MGLHHNRRGGSSTPSPSVDSKSFKLLSSFIVYCKQHPDERFWQALRNWSGYMFIFGADSCEGMPDMKHDTFYDEVKFVDPATSHDNSG